jgi:putative transposase
VAAQVARKQCLSEASTYAWRKKHGELDVSDIRHMRQLEHENARLKTRLAERDIEIESRSRVEAKRSELALQCLENTRFYGKNWQLATGRVAKTPKIGGRCQGIRTRPKNRKSCSCNQSGRQWRNLDGVLHNCRAEAGTTAGCVWHVRIRCG